MNLTPWNQKTYDEVMGYLRDGKRCAIIQATGTGKSSIIKKLVESFEGRKLILVPQKNLIDQYHRYGFGKDVDVITYAQLLSDAKANFPDYNYTMIIADELHRAGAKNWGNAFTRLLEVCSNAKVVGATATPKRMDQVNSDTVDLYFDGNRAGNLSLKEAISQGILPYPTYVASMYSLDEEIQSKLAKAESLNLPEEVKTRFVEVLEDTKVNWNKMDSLFTTFNDFLLPRIKKDNKGKVLVFCKNIHHLEDVRATLTPIFNRVFNGYTINIGEYHSQTTSDDYESFKPVCEPNTVNILFTVNKFNEGIHINDLSSVILLRDTHSEIIYYQQIGRVLSMGNKEPLIIDLVNNFNSIKQYGIWKELQEEKIKSNTAAQKETPVFFYNYIEDVEKIFEEIDNNAFNKYTYKNMTGSVYFLARLFHKNAALVQKKLSEGMTIDEAIESSPDVKKNSNHFYRAKNFLYNYLVYMFKTEGITVSDSTRFIELRARLPRVNSEFLNFFFDNFKKDADRCSRKVSGLNDSRRLNYFKKYVKEFDYNGDDAIKFLLDERIKTLPVSMLCTPELQEKALQKFEYGPFDMDKLSFACLNFVKHNIKKAALKDVRTYADFEVVFFKDFNRLIGIFCLPAKGRLPHSRVKNKDIDTIFNLLSNIGLDRSISDIYECLKDCLVSNGIIKETYKRWKKK